MSLKAKVTTLDGLDETTKALYKKAADEDFFILDVEPIAGFALENVTALTNALGRQKVETQDAKEALKTFEGLDPKKAREAIEKVAKFAGMDPEKDAERIALEKFEALKSQLVETHQGEIADRDKKLAAADKEVDDLTRRSSAISAIEKHGGNVTVLLPHVLNRTRPKTRDDGTRGVETLGEDGKTPAYGSNGQNLSLDELVGTMKQTEDFGVAFKAAGGSGSGAPPTNGPGGGGSPPGHPGTKKASDMSTDEKTKFIDEHGLDEWAKKVGKDYAPAASA